MNRTITFTLLCSSLALVGCPTDSGTDAGMDTGGRDTPPGTDTPSVLDTPSTTDAPSTTDTPVASPGCAAYCTSIMAACTGANAQYTDMTNCMAVCAFFPPGTAADMSGNTLGCRTYHAGAAATMGVVHCTHAGPAGDGLCGEDCDGYCNVALGACTGGNELYANRGECMTACAGITNDVPFNTGETSGDSLSCRIYHLSAAAMDPATHCDHGLATSAVCN